jgi:hypothetical protein
MDKTDHLMAEKNDNNKDSQKGQVTPKKYLKKGCNCSFDIDLCPRLTFFESRTALQFLNPYVVALALKEKKRDRL